MLSKPKPAQGFVVTGVLVQVVGALIFSVALPQSFSSYASSGAVVSVLFGAGLLIVGLVILLVGISRAVGGIDYLVAVAPTTGTGKAESGATTSAPEVPVTTGASV